MTKVVSDVFCETIVGVRKFVNDSQTNYSRLRLN